MWLGVGAMCVWLGVHVNYITVTVTSFFANHDGVPLLLSAGLFLGIFFRPALLANCSCTSGILISS